MKTLLSSFVFVTLMLSSSAFGAEQTHQCSFTKECIGIDGCGDTTFQLTIEKLDGGASIPEGSLVSTAPSHQIVTDAETLSAYAFASKDGKVAGVWAPRENGDFQSLTIAEDGVARYSIHMPTSELAIFYRGTCKAPS